jgi:hypothetical protein
MKLTLELGRDDELRNEVLGMIRAEVRNLTGEEIRSLVKQSINEQNIPSRVVAAFKDLVGAQIEAFRSGYGRLAAEDIIKVKFDEVVAKHFETFFQKQCIPFLTDYVKNKLESMGSSVNLIKSLIAGEDTGNK